MLRLGFRVLFLLGLTEALFQLHLGHDTTFFWNVDYNAGEIIAEIHTTNIDPNTDWTGIGFSNYGNISDGSGDFCILWTSQLGNNDNKPELTDVHIRNGTTLIQQDKQQDCLDFRHIYNKNGTLKWTFRRKFITCDQNDYAIEEGTTHLHWVKGNGPLFNINGVSITRAIDLGFIRARLRKNLAPDPILDPESTWKLDIINTKVKVPAVETMYWCHVMKLPETLKKKHQIVQFAVNVQKGNEDLVHHMEVFHCEAPPTTELPLYSGPCDESPKEISVCSRVMAAWAMGAEPLHYPAETGFPIGGEDFNPFVRLEIHYNNPQVKADWVDSSGMTFWLTSKFRSFDAGVIELGLEYTDKNSIPPSQDSFAVTGVCNFECTSVGLPSEGITVFASQLHTHLTGIRVVTRHFRKKSNVNKYYDDLTMNHNQQQQKSMDLSMVSEFKRSSISNSHSNSQGYSNFDATDNDNDDEYIELPTFNWDNHYSTHFQEIRLLKKQIKVYPGDVLLTSCEYKTTDRINMTLGGFAIRDEMCVNYIHYYPRTKLEVCKSSIAWKSLRNYFQFMTTMEKQKLDVEGPVSDNYNAIHWTPFRANVLENYYNESPIDMQCNQSDGSRFPGNWDSMPVPRFPPLQPKPNLNAECQLIAEDLNELNI